MASLESLPPDQRAVLQMVLQRGRSYDQIADLLSIDRAAVRQRALQALDALGPTSRVPPERRSLITDYLLGQLPARVASATRDRLAETPTERAWARVVASELTPLASGPLPEIPVEGSAPRARDPEPDTSPEDREPELAAVGAASARTEPPRQVVRPERGRDREPREPRDGRPPTSRRGGAILLGLLALVVIAVVIVVIATSGGSSPHKSTSSVAASTPSTTGASTTTSTTSSASPQIVAQVNLTSPDASSKAAGAAFVLKSGATRGILIRAQRVPPNTKHNAYAVWLFNSASDSRILGFVSPGVGSNGQLSTAGGLPSNASHFKEILVTRETARNPKQPGAIVLQGALTGVS